MKNEMITLDIPEAKSGVFEIRHQHYPANHKFELANARTIFIGGDKKGFVSFKDKHTIHRLYEGDSMWMTDSPIEQVQCWNAIKDFSGNVLVGGLGLGVAVTMLSKIEAVKSIWVVEISQDVVDLVYPYIKNDKIICITDDLFKFLEDKNVRLDKYDYAFYDIWASDGEGTFFDTVVPLRQLSVGIVPSHNVLCWNENVMRGQVYYSLQSRYLQVAKFTTGKGSSELKLKLMGVEKDDRMGKWIDWSVLFFQWAFSRERNDDQIASGMMFYSQIYGMENWNEQWEKFNSLNP